MAEAAKLFDQKSSGASGTKQEAVNSAGMTIMKLLVQSKSSGFIGGSNSGGLSGVMGLVSLSSPPWKRQSSYYHRLPTSCKQLAAYIRTVYFLLCNEDYNIENKAADAKKVVRLLTMDRIILFQDRKAT